MDTKLHGPNVCLDVVGIERSLTLLRIEPQSFKPQPVTLLTELSHLTYTVLEILTKTALHCMRIFEDQHLKGQCTYIIKHTCCGYEVPGIMLLCNFVREPRNLIVVRTCFCMFHLASVMISMHQCQLCGSCGADKMCVYRYLYSVDK